MGSRTLRTLLVVVAALLAGCADASDAPAVETADAQPPADAPTAPAAADVTTSPPTDAETLAREEPFVWDGLTPRGVFVCSLPGCYGESVPTDWFTTLPGDAAVLGASLTLTWTPVDATVGPLAFRLDRLLPDGASENLLTLTGESPIEMIVDELAFAEGEAARITVWPVAKVRGDVGAVFVDLSEQPFHVEGLVRSSRG